MMENLKLVPPRSRTGEGCPFTTSIQQNTGKSIQSKTQEK